jgi:ribosome recycling factor
MTDNADPNLRFANAGAAHHDAVQKLIQAFRDKSAALDTALAAKAVAESDKDKLSEYLEQMTASITSEIDSITSAKGQG